MACCGKSKQVIGRVRQIAQGYSRYVSKKKCPYTDDRIRVCQTCAENYWIGKSLWCRMCKCFVPAAARSDDKDCPLGKWKE